MDPLSDFLAKHGFLLGCAFLGFVIFHVGTTVAGQVAALACAVRQLSQKRIDNDLPGSIEENLGNLAETIDSLHRLFGGRQWQRDELDHDLEGPTIQSLLQSIAKSLRAMAPERTERPKVVER